MIKIIDLEQNLDDRGILYEVIRTDMSFKPDLNQVYVVKDRVKGIIRAYHRHKKLVDYFHILTGSAKFVFFKEISETTLISKMDKKEVILDSRKPQLIIVPSGIYHGWMSLEDNTILLSVASHCYNKDNPDEERIDPNIIPNIWTIKAK